MEYISENGIIIIGRQKKLVESELCWSSHTEKSDVTWILDIIYTQWVLMNDTKILQKKGNLKVKKDDMTTSKNDIKLIIDDVMEMDKLYMRWNNCIRWEFRLKLQKNCRKFYNI